MSSCATAVHARRAAGRPVLFDTALEAPATVDAGHEVIAAPEASAPSAPCNGTLSSGWFYRSATPDPVPVPEPGTFALVGLALAGLGLGKRRSRK